MTIRVRENIDKSRTTVLFFLTFCSSGGSKSRLAKAAGADPFDGRRYKQLHAAVADLEIKILEKYFILGALLEGKISKKCTRQWHEAHVEVKMVKALFLSHGRSNGICTLPKATKT